MNEAQEGVKFMRAPNFSTSLLERLNNQRQSSEMCDLTLIAETQEFCVHRCVVAAASDFFAAMSRSGMQETKQAAIELKGVSAKGLKAVIDFTYSGEISLSLDNIGDVISAVNHLQVSQAIRLCEDFIIDETSTDNCVDILNLAELYSATNVREKVVKFILKHFSVLVGSEQLKKLNVDQLAVFLSSDKLQLSPEIRVFDALLRWLKGSEGRLQHGARLVGLVRLHTMKPEEFVDKVSRLELMRADHECNRLLVEGLEYFALPSRQYTSTSPRSTIRNQALMVCLNESVYFLDQREERWRYLCDSPATTKALSQRHVVVNNFLYVCGGFSENDRQTTNRCFRFDPRTLVWSSIAPMKRKRQFFTLAASTDTIVAVGGVYGDKGNFYATYPVQTALEVYSIERNDWREIDLDQTIPILKWPGACVFDRKVFIVGGKLCEGPNQALSQKSYLVDLDTGCVQERAPSITTRFNPSVFYRPNDRGTALDSIILFGGEDEKYRLAPCVERYAIETDQWSEIVAIPVSLSYQCISNSCITGNRIYYLLEEHNGPSSEMYSLQAAFFDLTTGAFEGSVQLPHPSTMASKWCTLTFPQEVLERVLSHHPSMASIASMAWNEQTAKMDGEAQSDSSDSDS